jgi:hypothetical protein
MLVVSFQGITGSPFLIPICPNCTESVTYLSEHVLPMSPVYTRDGGRGGEEGWVVDGEGWAEAFEAWLEGKASGHTRKAYRKAWQLLVTQTEKMPWEIEQEDLLDWVEAMGQEGASPKSIQLRLAAISSFYGELKPLGIRNPVEGVNIWQRDSGEGLTRER